MTDDEVVAIVEQAAEVDREQALRAIRATLQTLAERIARGEARDLAAELPPATAAWVATTADAEGFDVDEFLRRVADREGVDIVTAERHARAVLDAVARAISPRELADVAAELPRDFARLLPRGPALSAPPPDRFVRAVADRAQLDDEGARRAAEAVLETLAERIAGGEVDDLLARLPVTLHEPLRRGREHGTDQARRLGVDEFLRRVAEREGAPPALAMAHTRAVLAVLRQTVGDAEFSDVTVQLPQEFKRALVPAGPS